MVNAMKGAACAETSCSAGTDERYLPLQRSIIIISPKTELNAHVLRHEEMTDRKARSSGAEIYHWLSLMMEQTVEMI